MSKTEKHCTLRELRTFFHCEIINETDSFSWRRILRKSFSNRRKCYLFWFRIAYYLHRQKSRFCISLAKSINKRLIKKYNTEIMLGATIGPGLLIGHNIGIVVTDRCIIGKNFLIRQNTTIGYNYKFKKDSIMIGDNVEIGANSCIIGSRLNIGNNVVIGAGSLILKDLPENSIVYNKSELIVKPR